MKRDPVERVLGYCRKKEGHLQSYEVEQGGKKSIKWRIQIPDHQRPWRPGEGAWS